MAGALGCDPGGIQGLLTLPAEQWEAIEADCLATGWHVADLNWREIRSIVKHSGPGSALYRVVHGELAAWTVTDHLLAHILDKAAWLVWAKSKDGLKNVRQPKPIPRPGDDQRKSIADAELDESGALRGDGTFHAGTAMTIDELNALFAQTT